MARADLKQLLDNLSWRYATKRFDPSFKLSQEEEETILESMRLTPSSFGLEPWGFVVVTNEEVKRGMVPISWNQMQVADASHTVVLCRRRDFDESYVTKALDHMAKTRGVQRQTLEGYEQVILGFINKHSPEHLTHWITSQVYIALGQLLSVCASLRIDAAPIEGFDRNQMNDYLKLADHGLEAVVICAIGKRSDEDKYSEAIKVRRPLEDVIVRMD